MSTDQIDDELREHQMSVYSSSVSTPSGLFQLNEELIRQQFMKRRQRGNTQGVFWKGIKNGLRRVLTCLMLIFDELWIEIVPPIIRGSIEEREMADPATIFAPMPQSKIVFYLIILTDGYEGDLIEKMKGLKLEGFAFQKEYLMAELFHPSTCHALHLHDLKEPIVVFLKYNSAGELILIGRVGEAQLIKLNANQIIKLKEEAQKVSKRYDQLQKQLKQQLSAIQNKPQWKQL